MSAHTFADIMWKTESATKFANLKGSGNIILRNKPNHMMIRPSVFALAEGTQGIRAKSFAFQIINRLCNDHDDRLQSSAGEPNTSNDVKETTPTPSIAGREDNREIELLESGGASRGRPNTNDHDSDETPEPKHHYLLDDVVDLQRPRGGAGADIKHLLAWLWACEKNMVLNQGHPEKLLLGTSEFIS